MTAGVLLVAKAPVAGVAKTRLGATVGPAMAAQLAAAALLDTLDACEQAFPPGHRVLALSGDLADAAHACEITARLRSWIVIPQRSNDFARRLSLAHLDAAAILAAPVVQLGTDTPQVTSRQLHVIGARLESGRWDAALGPAIDGGWWMLGLRNPHWARGLVDVPMSTSRTGEDTRWMLMADGARVTQVAALRDVDTAGDAAAVSHMAPYTRFAQIWQRVRVDRHSAAELFDAALSGAHCLLHGLPSGPFELPVSSWRGLADETDTALVDRCAGPTLDVGCGPGRLTHELSRRGLVALGIDIAPRAVLQTRARGAQALRRDVFHPLPAEGRWGSVLLADGNIGIGGDPLRLLRRVHDLLAPAGRAVVEVAPVGTAAAAHQVHLEVDGKLSYPFTWAVLGPEALGALAQQASMRMLSVTAYGGRCIVQLDKVVS